MRYYIYVNKYTPNPLKGSSLVFSYTAEVIPNDGDYLYVNDRTYTVKGPRHISIVPNENNLLSMSEVVHIHVIEVK